MLVDQRCSERYCMGYREILGTGEVGVGLIGGLWARLGSLVSSFRGWSLLQAYSNIKFNVGMGCVNLI